MGTLQKFKQESTVATERVFMQFFPFLPLSYQSSELHAFLKAEKLS